MQKKCQNNNFTTIYPRKKRNLAAKNLTLLILGLFLMLGKSPGSLWAWNEDYAYGLPKQREFCAKRDSADTWDFRPLGRQNQCQRGEAHYIAVFVKEPRGAIALIKLSKYQGFFPKPGLKWPPEATQADQGLWHFTCLGDKVLEVLDSRVTFQVFLGDLTASAKQSCETSRENALHYCQKHLKGRFLLESCGSYW